MSEKPQTIEEWQEKSKEFIRLLIEARDALPAINMVSARLHNVRLDLGDRIESALEPWKIS